MLEQVDTSLFFAFNHFLQELLPASAVVFLTNQNEYLFLVLALALIRKRQWAETARLVALMLVAVAVSDALGFVLKELIGRERPCHALEGARVLVYCGKSFSMPSNHALNTFTLAGVALFMSKDRLRYAFVVLAALVALTRPIVGVHGEGFAAIDKHPCALKRVAGTLPA
ncbi:MAG TPA: phosphatase PAP2 family protein, partial [Nitrospirae bacterium]|nr:phosphatase PAP2 family protein [Nitrospirota bacterium]